MVGKGSYLKPEEINFHFNYDTLDPFKLYDFFPQPEYLEISYQDELMQEFENGDAFKKEAKSNKGDQDEEESMMINEESQSVRNSEMSSREVYMNQSKAKKQRCCGKKAKPFSSIPNRHERLFTCGRKGKQFSNNTI